MLKGGNFMLKSDPKWIFWGFWSPRGPWGCSSWSKMVPGHWYTVPHYATALPGCILGFKIPNLVKIWPEMPQRCSFWGYRAPRGPRACLSWSKIVPDHWYTVPNCHNPWTILNTPGELLGAQKKQNTPQNEHFGGISGQIFTRFGILKPKMQPGRAVA